MLFIYFFSTSLVLFIIFTHPTPFLFKRVLCIVVYENNGGEDYTMKAERLRNQSKEAPNQNIYFEDSSKDDLYKKHLAYFLS